MAQRACASGRKKKRKKKEKKIFAAHSLWVIVWPVPADYANSSSLGCMHNRHLAAG
jgi:hypothetical protein